MHIEKALYKFFLLENCAKYCLDPEPEKISQVGTGTQQIFAVPQHCINVCAADPGSNLGSALPMEV
jgi:hypothetical protein